MGPSPTNLANALEDLVQDGHGGVTESPASLVVTGLSATDAIAIIDGVTALDWALTIEDATPEIVSLEQVSEAFGPYRLVIDKPAAPPDVAIAVTRAGLTDWLRNEARPAVLWAAGLEAPFETRANRIAPWGDTQAFSPTPTGCDPRKVVRELSPERVVTGCIDHWLLRDIESSPPSAHWAFGTWARSAFNVLVRALSDEVEEDGNLLFRGPPVSRLTPEADLVMALDVGGMRAVQLASAWVFEAPAEMRPRHDLFAPEIARSAHSGSGAGAAFRLAAGPALEGAIMARAFGLSEISRDSLKAMADLRKAVGEEIGKLSETTRGIAAAVAAALFAGIALIAARLVIDQPTLIIRQVAAVIGLVLFLYVAAIIISGWQYVRLQGGLRREWRSKIYRFMPDDDYKSMVTDPAASAELGFFIAAWLGGIAATALLSLVLYTAFTDFPVPPVQNQIPPARTSQASPREANATSSAMDKPQDVSAPAPNAKSTDTASVKTSPP